MKSPEYKRKFYRDRVVSRPRGLYRKKIVVRETDLDITCDNPLDEKYLAARIKEFRRRIEGYISRDERFLTALKPLTVESAAPKIVRDMAAASRKANVGPMASVAGAIAECVGRDLMRRGAKNVIVENGGDIFLKIERPVRVGIFAGRTNRLGKLGLRIRPRQTPLGICSSSGTIGHSLSFGNADCAVILAKSAILADAAATAVANKVQTKDDLEAAIRFSRSIKGLIAAVIIIGDNLASWGEVEFV